ncbi:MAG: UDP-N-acetylmuramoyl-L-alanine--D-glutamate ligase [Caldiserica bacterium]|nr:UDP-N-acetylmuramoyl-L-alanine--D-glutamate ligase [Caldisericota bacterium]
MKLRGKKVSVVGLGISGMEAALFLQEKGAEVWITERNTSPELEKRLQGLTRKGIQGELGKHTLSRIREADLVVLSSGVNPAEVWIQELKEEGKEVIGELDLGLMHLSSPYIGVTGSNGKTTTVHLLKHLLGEEAEIAGNVGIPITRLLRTGEIPSWLILEISSFQLKSVKKFQPYLSIILNISPDHLDWHANFNDYRSAKMRIFQDQEKNTFTLWNAEEDWWELQKTNARNYFFSATHHSRPGCFVKDNWIIWRDKKEEAVMPVREWRLQGRHNLSNLTAALAAGILLGKPLSLLREKARTFPGLPHRLEIVRWWKGIQFVNDSKATNVDAVYHALLSLPPGIILILGGQDKGNDYSPLFSLTKTHLKKIIAIGESRDKIYQEFSPLIEVIKVKSFPEAVKISSKSASYGDTVLLSPACASFDMFSNFKERGEVFRKLVEELP